ncbi:hypothetical protein V7O66_13810 [Methanolobus sp. ZRKC3]|uniref:hypothetical protein n=1 Tax=Methanolobus sp. ZRKC3 TaxID=3125786 RepID=UPI0032538996
MIISTVLSDKPIISGDTVTLPIVKAGTKARGADGKIYTIVQDAINSSAETFTGGTISINHRVREEGNIIKSWQEGDTIMATVGGLTQKCVDIVNSPAYNGVSQESINATITDGGEVVKLQGSGLAFVIYPETPGCPLEMGCGIPIASSIAAVSDDEDRHDFDVAAKNNAGKLVKIREISVYVWGDDCTDEDILKTRIINEAMFIGPGEFLIFDRDDNLSLGDEIQSDLEPMHNVTITISMLSSFNFPLYTHNRKLESNTPGGVNIADDVTQKLESTISEQKTEIESLKSTIGDLRQELKDKEGKLESTVQAAVKAAMESRDQQLKEQSDMDAAMTELKSCMGEETMTEFLKAEPSVAVIKSTISAIKAEAGKQIGASGGQQLNSTDDGGSLSGLYLGGD